MASERQHPDMTIEEELGHAMIARAEMEMMWAESHDEVQRLRTLLAERDAEVAWLVVREAVLERAIEKAADWHSLPPHEFEGKWGRGWEDSPDADGLIAADLRAALAARGGES